MFGEGKWTTLPDLSQSLKLIPLFAKADASGEILDGLRRNAENTANPFLRVWARFVVELGVNSADKYDILNGAPAENVRLDAVQNLLILRRLYGELFALGEKYKTPPRAENRSTGNVRFVNANFSIDSDVFQSFRRQNINYDTAQKAQIIENTTALTLADEKEIPCKMDGDATITWNLKRCR